MGMTKPPRGGSIKAGKSTDSLEQSILGLASGILLMMVLALVLLRSDSKLQAIGGIAVSAWIAAYFDNIDQAEDEGICEKLRLYYDNEDSESNFTVARELGRREIEGEVAKSLLPLAAVYDMALGYCQPQADRTRAFDYLALVQ